MELAGFVLSPCRLVSLLASDPRFTFISLSLHFASISQTWMSVIHVTHVRVLGACFFVISSAIRNPHVSTHWVGEEVRVASGSLLTHSAETVGKDHRCVFSDSISLNMRETQYNLASLLDKSSNYFLNAMAFNISISIENIDLQPACFSPEYGLFRIVLSWIGSYIHWYAWRITWDSWLNPVGPHLLLHL